LWSENEPHQSVLQLILQESILSSQDSTAALFE